jgi:hypothetical protein
VPILAENTIGGTTPVSPINAPILGENSASLESLERELTAIESRLQSLDVSADELRVEEDHLIVGDLSLRFSPIGLQRFCRWVKAPADYLCRLDPDIRSQVLQRHIERGDFKTAGNKRLATTIVATNGEFRGICRGDLALLSTRDVLSATRDGIGLDADTIEVRNFTLENDALLLDLVSPRISEEVRPGDAIHGGIRLQHSLLGDSATTVETYLLRLVCRNGLTRRQCVSKRSARTRRLGGDLRDARRLQVEQVRRLVHTTWSGLRDSLVAIRALQDEPLDAEPLWRQFLGRARMYSQTLLELLHQAWEAEGREATAYGALNAMTRVATHATNLSRRHRQALMALAGVFDNRHVHICPRCFSVIQN